MKRPSVSLVLGVLTVAVLAVSVPGSLREAHAHGGFYLFSVRFFEDIPKRLAGPGRLRFFFQPAMAIFLGWRAGRADARAGRPPFLRGLLLHAEHRAAVVRDTIDGIAVLLLMGILLDSAFQWVLLGTSYPGAALVVGPVLITVPYLASRALTGALGRRKPPPPGPEHSAGGASR
jgi:hypothetical protein